MKIVILHDFKRDPGYGGAEKNMVSLAELAESKGHLVDWYGFERDGNALRMDAPAAEKVDGDLLILGSITMLDPRWVNHIVERWSGKIVAWCHDSPWCMNRCGMCMGRFHPNHNGCQMGWYWQLYTQATTVYCYSPGHEERITAAFGDVIKTHVLPIFCNDARKFYEARTEKVPGSCIVVGRQSEAKGGKNTCMFARRNPDFAIDIYGMVNPELQAALAATAPNATVHGAVPFESLVEKYGKAEYFFHQPEVYDAGPRTVVEARLAGCKLLISNSMGYPNHSAWNLSDEDLIKHCETSFAYTLDHMLEGA